MKQEIKLDQGSKKWLDFRRNFRMASETSAVMGMSKYKTKNDVRNSKLGIEQIANLAMRQGSEQEAVAREHYNLLNETMRPAVFVDGLYGASLDGINLEQNKILEIKTPYKNAKNSDRWKIAEHSGKILDEDLMQVQHQLMVTGADSADFLIWDHDNKECIIVEVFPDEEIWGKIKSSWNEFWPTIEKRTDKNWEDAAKEYILYRNKLEELELLTSNAKLKLLGLMSGDFSHGGGVSIKKVNKIGMIDWKKVKDEYLLSCNLENFRKPSFHYFEIKLENNIKIDQC